ncbi:hypothetical protein EYR40_005890 [Pleurotus pulmonarius]|nr:hypothetical protein EYR36_005726 [Pleurotus pulmonarius]KAF4602675.1 hypothetical protein EYR40_005890 [Pleurotus pulmonarius]
MPDFVIDLSTLFVVNIGTYITVVLPQVSSAALLAYDYFLTLPDEIQYVWPTHWCLGKVLYLSSKYLIIVIFLAELHWITSHNVPEAECRTSNTILHYGYLLAVIAAENILTLRVWALWNQRRWVTIMLGCLCIVGIALGFKDISTGYQNDIYLTDYAKASLSYPGCATVGDDRTASATSYITVLAHETDSTMPISSMMYTFYEDGLIYYAALLAISIVNMIVSLTQPVEFINLFFPYVFSSERCVRTTDTYMSRRTSTQVVLHSTLSSRLFLNLRQSLDGEVEETRRIDIRTFEGGSSRGLSTSTLRFAVNCDDNDEDNTIIA